MKILIVSDSHGSKKELNMILNRHQHTMDAMIHCGDSELKYNEDVMEPFLKVRGNCDLDTNYPEEEIQKIGPLQFFVTHGHLYNVKMSLMNILYRASELEAAIVCFGHSHIAYAEQVNGVILINPGSIHLPKLRKEKTYVICEINEKEVKVIFYNEEGIEVDDLTSSFQIK